MAVEGDNKISASSGEIGIEVAYALPQQQFVERLSVPVGTTAREALGKSSLSKRFPDLDLVHCPVGIFGRELTAEYVLQADDRVEVYRPLEMDPREARRILAQQGATMGSQKK